MHRRKLSPHLFQHFMTVIMPVTFLKCSLNLKVYFSCKISVLCLIKKAVKRPLDPQHQSKTEKRWEQRVMLR